MIEILNEPLEPEDGDSPMPDDIKEVFTWLNETNVHQLDPRIEEVIAHMRKLRAQWEDTGKPTKDVEAPTKTIDLAKLMKNGKPLVAAPAVPKIRRI